MALNIRRQSHAYVIWTIYLGSDPWFQPTEQKFGKTRDQYEQYQDSLLSLVSGNLSISEDAKRTTGWYFI